MDIMAYLQNVPIFSKLSKQALWRLAGLAQTTTFEQNEILMNEGDQGDACYVIVKGKVEVIKENADQKSTVIATLSKGEIIGEMSVIDNEPRSATVKAIEPTECIVISQWDFMAQMQAYPEIALQLIPVLVKRLREAEKNVR